MREFCVNTSVSEELIIIFGFKKNNQYPPEKFSPAIRCSICTGEMTAGFKDLSTGKFIDVALIKNDSELADFKKKYGIVGLIEKIY